MLIPNMLVDVYLNLNRPGQLSVRAAEGVSKGRVVGYTPAIELADCAFRVSEAGRQRVIREQCKNVHATVRGRIVQFCAPDAVPSAMTDQARQLLASGGLDVTYEPYRHPSFFERTSLAPVFASPRVIVVGKRVAVAPGGIA